MTEAELKTSFLESFDPATFNVYDYTFSGNTIDAVNKKLATIAKYQKQIANIQKNAANGTSGKYAKNIASYTDQRDGWQDKYNRFTANPVKAKDVFPAPAAYDSYIKRDEAALVEARAAGDTKEVAKLEAAIKKNQAKYDSEVKSLTAKLQGYINKAQANIDKYAAKNVASFASDIKAAQGQIDKNADYIAGYYADAQGIIGGRLEDEIGNIVERLDRIDDYKARQLNELTGEGAANGINLDFIAEKDQQIADTYDIIYERLGNLVDDLAYYGAEVPSEFKDVNNLRDFYSDIQKQATDQNISVGDLLGTYVDNVVDTNLRNQAIEAKAAGTDGDTDYLMGLADLAGYTNAFKPPAPLSQQQNVIAAYENNPQAARQPSEIQLAMDAYFDSLKDYNARLAAGETGLERPEFDLGKLMDEQFAIDTTPLPGSREYAAASQAPDFVGPSGLTREQSNDLARQLMVLGNVTIADDQGRILTDQLGTISNAILNNGFQDTFNKLNVTYASVPELFVDADVANKFIADLSASGGYNPSPATAASWAKYAQTYGLDKAAEEYLKVNPGINGAVTGLTPDQMAVYNTDNDLARQSAITNNKIAFDKNVEAILSGEDFSFGTPANTVEDFINTVYGQQINPDELDPEQKSVYDRIVGYYNYYDPETALGILNQTMGYKGKSFAFTAPEAPFEPNIYGEETTPTTTTPTTPGVTPPTVTTPTTTTPYTPPTPTTGVPGFAFQPGQIRGYAPTTQAPTETTTYQPAPYTPPPLLAEAPARPAVAPAQQLVGAPVVDRGMPVPMSALTPQEAGSTFQQPTQEDYYAFFGYTPEQLNAAQYLAELEGAPRAGIAAQTVPTLPPAVTGAPPAEGMKEGGAVQNSGLMAAAQELSSKGRNGDKVLVHMTIDEVNDLQNYAQQLGGSLTINPYTGLPEANFFRRVGRGLKRLAVPIVAALAAPYLPAIAGSTALTAGLLAGAGTMLGGGNLQQGLQTGLMAGMGASLAQGAGYQGIPGVQTPAQTAASLQSTGGSAMGAAVDAGTVSLTPSPGDLDYIAAADKSLLGKTTDYLSNIPSAVGQGLSNMDLGDAAMLGYVGVGAMGLKENQQAQRDYEAYMAGLEEERRRKKAAGTAAFERAFAAKGGLMRLAQGGMTYAEGGGTTGPTNEPRMVKGTGDGMSDSVPATIEGVQEARLANDEFVVPADVVADLGNGSSSAGAQQLYDMMDRVRQARHGTTKQPPEIDVRKIMPA